MNKIGIPTMINYTGPYTALRHRCGNNDKTGQWELIATRDEKGNNEITIWTTNIPCGVEEGQSFQIDEIQSVQCGMKKDASGVWRPNVAINAKVSLVKSEFDSDSAFGDDDPFGNDDGCPWNDMDGDLPL